MIYVAFVWGLIGSAFGAMILDHPLTRETLDAPFYTRFKILFGMVVLWPIMIVALAVLTAKAYWEVRRG